MTTDTSANHCSATVPFAGGLLLTFDPRWRTETVVALARGIDADAAFDRLPILADALEEAGCDLPQVLTHCRHCSQHAADCWALSLALDRRPPSTTLDDLIRDPEFRDAFRRLTEPRLVPELVPTRPPPDPRVPIHLILVTLAIGFVVIRGVVGLSTSATSQPTEYPFTTGPTLSDEQLRVIGGSKPAKPSDQWPGYNERFTPSTADQP